MHKLLAFTGNIFFSNANCSYFSLTFYPLPYYMHCYHKCPDASFFLIIVLYISQKYTFFSSSLKANLVRRTYNKIQHFPQNNESCIPFSWCKILPLHRSVQWHNARTKGLELASQPCDTAFITGCPQGILVNGVLEHFWMLLSIPCKTHKDLFWHFLQTPCNLNQTPHVHPL